MYHEKGFVLEASIERGRKLPKWASHEPSLLNGDEFYLEAFWELSTCRSIGMALGPIPWRDIVLYAQFVGLEYDLVTVFVGVIRSMDRAYLEWADKKKSSNPKPSKRNR